MKRTSIVLGVTLIALHLLPELHSFVRAIWPQSVNWDVAWFWKNINFKINILWWIKMVSDDLLFCGTYCILAWVAFQYSRKLYYIASVYVFYHIIDMMLFFYNYKQTTLVYWLILAATITATVLLIIPLKEKAQCKSLV